MATFRKVWDDQGHAMAWPCTVMHAIKCRATPWRGCEHIKHSFN